MDTSRPTQNSSDDFELVPLFIRALAFFRRFGKGILLISLLGMIVGGLLYYTLPRSYKATMVLQSSVLSNQQSLQVIDGWDGLVSKRGRPVLARFFGLPMDTLQDLESITPTLIPGPADDAGITVEVKVSDSTILPSLQRGMIYALETNPYIQQRIAVRKQNLEIQLEQARQELSRLDSVKPYLHSFSESEKDASGKLILDVSNITNERLSCEDRIAAGIEKLHFLNAAYVLQGFVQTKASKVVPAPVLPLTGLLLGFLLSYGLALSTLFREKYPVKGKPVTA